MTGVDAGNARARGLKVCRYLSLFLGAISCAALVSVAWIFSRAESPLPLPVSTSHLYAVTLTSGQVYYGIVRESSRVAISMEDVYYVQSFNQTNGQVDNRLVSRFKNDWHAPAQMVLPVERILYLESVDANSRLAGLIAQDKRNARTP
jgi:hypothetical protein